MKIHLIQFINKFLNILGYTLKISKNIKSKYSTIYTSSQYSPWNIDSDFQKLWSIINKKYTLSDERRCYELWELMDQIIKLPEGIVLEIGVWRGGTGILMTKKLKMIGDQTKVYLADTFEGIVKASEKDNYCVGGEFSNTSVETVHELAKIMEVTNYDILKGVYPDQTGEKVKDLKIRLCHIDVDVYDGAKDIVNEIWERLVPGGVVVFDDYGCKDTEGINTFVNEQKKLKDRLVIYNLNGHAIIIKI